MGSTILSVDGVPLRGMSMDEVKQLTMGLVGTHVSVRYRLPGVHAEYPPLEKVLTRMPASYAAGLDSAPSHISPCTKASSTDPSRGQQSTRKMEHADVKTGSTSLDSFRSSVSSWFTSMGLLTSRSGVQDHENTRLAISQEGNLSGTEHSQRASQREAFLKGDDDEFLSLNKGLIRQIADEYRCDAFASFLVTPRQDLSKLIRVDWFACMCLAVCLHVSCMGVLQGESKPAHAAREIQRETNYDSTAVYYR